MPVVVACRCGRRFAAKEQMVGQHVPCPGCGTLLTVGADAAANEGIYVDCGCGRAFWAPENMRGHQARCPGCGAGIQVGASRKSAAAPPPVPFDPLSAPPATADDEIPWDKLKLIGKVGALALGLLIAISIGRSLWSWGATTIKAQREAADALATIPGTPRPSAPVAPPGSAAVNDVQGSSPFGSTKVPETEDASSSSGGVPVAKLPGGVRSWYEQPGELRGNRRVSAGDTPVAQYSWLTGLLPFIGHAALYEKFDFSQPLTKGKNLELGGVLIPEFLNPLDDHQRWKGYPFDGIALTHFVGMSGVEDTRNVVAAKLPRSDPRAGVFGYDEVARVDQIADGASQTIMVAGAGSLPNPWICGGGATIRAAREPLFDKTSGIGTKGVPGGGSIVVMADGSVKHVTGGVDPKVFRAMCTIRGGETVDWQDAAKPFDLKTLGPAPSAAPTTTAEQPPSSQ